jgi:GNAT superfamily N-acetyltransferase
MIATRSSSRRPAATKSARGVSKSARTKRAAPAKKSPSQRPTQTARSAKPARKAGASAETRNQISRPNRAPKTLHWDETLADGTPVFIRPIGKGDAALERAFIKRLSPETRRMRFLGQLSEPSDDLVRALTDIDYQRDMAFVALVDYKGKPREIGVSRYSTGPDGATCECAVTVSDEWQQKGLGTLLMRHLIDVARSRGIRTMMSLDSAGNLPMRDLAEFLGFERRTDPQDPSQVIHTLVLR